MIISLAPAVHACIRHHPLTAHVATRGRSETQAVTIALGC